MEVQLFGERCSGTNFVEQLILRNIPKARLIRRFGFKHFFPEHLEEVRDEVFVVVHRNPIDWLHSMQKHPWHAHRSLWHRPFGDFIRAEWHCVWDDHSGADPGGDLYGTEMMHERDPATGARFANILRLRSAKIAAFEGLRQHVPNFHSVRLETLRADPEKFVDALAEVCRIDRAPVFDPVTDYKGGFYLSTRLLFRASFGLLGRYRATRARSVRPDDLRFLRETLDLEQEATLGYTLPDLHSPSADRRTEGIG